MARKSNKISILQMDALGCSWMRVQPSATGVLIEEYLQVPARGEEELVRELTALASGKTLSEDLLCTVLPRHEITARVLTLPTQNPQEAENMVRLSAEEYVPYGLDELIVDAPLIETLPGGESRILAVLAHKDVVRNHVNLLRQAGLAPQRIFLSTACLVSAAAAANLAERGPCALAHLWGGGLEVATLRGAALHFTRGVASAQDWRSIGSPEGTDALEELAVELRNSLSAYRRESEDGMGADHTYVSSDHADESAVCEALRKEMAIETLPSLACGTLVAPESVTVPRQPLVLIGAALSAMDRAALTVDLMPEDLVKSQEFDRIRQIAKRGLSMAAVIMLALSIYFLQGVLARRSYVRELQKQVAALAPQAQGVSEKQERLRMLREQVAQNGTVLEMLAQASAEAPETKLTITQFEYDNETGIQLFGRALQREDVVRYADKLRGLAATQLKLWETASYVYIQEGSEYGKNIFMYQIQVPFAQETSSEQTLTTTP